MRVALGLPAILVGVCLALRIDGWFWLGLVLMVWGLLQMPTEEEEQARMERCCIGYRRGFIGMGQDVVRARSTHGLGECSGVDCRL